MSIALTVNSQLRFKRQSAKGSIASNSGAQILRRETATFNLAKEAYTTESEIASHQQLASNRHGVRLVNGKIANIFSPGTFADMVSAVLRRDFAAVALMSGLTITVSGMGPTYTVERATGSWLTDGVKVGMVIRLDGAAEAENDQNNLLVSGVTATDLTVFPVNGDPLADETATTSVDVQVVGKVTYAPATGHTNVYYTVETWDPDVPSSERNLDVKVSQIAFALPGSGNSKIDITAVGLDQQFGTSAYFSAPTAETTTDALVAASGVLLVGGLPQAVITDLSFTVDGGENPAEGVVGSNIRPDIFRGIIKVNGSFTAYFDSRTMADNFVNEVATSICAVLTDGTAKDADFVSFFLPKVDCTSADSDDGIGKGKKRTFNFVAEFNATGGSGQATEKTTLQIQDSAAA